MATGLVAEHQIFHAPLPVDLEFETIETPKHYHKNPAIDPGPTMRGWAVHRELKAMNNGLVLMGNRFTDSPDCEFIASGLNDKSPAAVALGRQGNWFHWGFCAAPDEMTEAAQRVFVNTVVYINTFDGQRPYVMKRNATRESTLSYVKYLGDERLGQWALDHLDPVLVAAADDDAERLRDTLVANMDWVYIDTDGRGNIDADARRFGFANNDVQLLDACISALPDPAAHRVLARYTRQNFPDARAWRTWFDEARDQLFFTDAGGFLFMVPPDNPTALPTAAIAVAPPGPAQIVTAGIGIVEDRIRPADVITIEVHVRIAPTWHIYTMQATDSLMLPTKIELTLPEGFEALGPWAAPPGHDQPGATVPGYDQQVRFHRTVRVSHLVQPGDYTITAHISYQACDANICRPPQRDAMATTVRVNP